MKKTIRIKSANLDTYWYADKVGETYDILTDVVVNDSYAIAGEGSCFIRIEDCEDVTEMGEQNSKHYIADGKYGAELEREYEEVAEKADVGDYVLVTDGRLGEEPIGEIVKTTEVFRDLIYTDGEYLNDGSALNLDDDEYKTLRPTQPEVVRLKSDAFGAKGERYELAERKAEVGELVVVTKGDGWYEDEVGSIYEVIDGHEYGFNVCTRFERQVYVEHSDNKYGEINCLEDGHYLVLKPLKPTLESLIDGIKGGNPHAEVGAEESQPEEAPKFYRNTTEGLIANLARRVSELERRLDEKQYAIYELESKLSGLESDYEESDKQTEKWAENVNGQLRNLQRNLETFAQETTSTRLLAKDAKELAQANEKDIVTLDERTNTQPQPKETELMREIRQLLESFEAKEGE